MCPIDGGYQDHGDSDYDCGDEGDCCCDGDGDEDDIDAGGGNYTAMIAKRTVFADMHVYTHDSVTILTCCDV